MILKNPMKFKVYLYSGFVDMRRSWSLYDFIKGTLNLDPLSESLFLFSGRSRKLIKVFYWDGNGFCIWQKKLEKGKFGWVSESEKERTIVSDKLTPSNDRFKKSFCFFRSIASW